MLCRETDDLTDRATGTVDSGLHLDPDIQRFAEMMSAAWAQHPPLDSVSRPEARLIAEAVREPWARGGPTMQRTTEHFVPFGAGRVRIRVLDSSGAPGQPALVYLHGGGWTMFSIDTHDRLMREYAHRAGATVVAVDYSLSPEVKFPRALQECAAVVKWLRTHGSLLDIDSRRMAIGGDSAGGNLSLATALLLRDQGGADALRGTLLNYGVFDSSCDFPSYRRFGGAGYMLSDGEMVGFWRNYVGGEGRSEDPLACPLRAQLTGLPPAFLAIADCDVLCDENLAMAERFRQFDVPVTARVYQGATHSFLEAMSISALANRALDDGSAWLRDVLRG